MPLKRLLFEPDCVFSRGGKNATRLRRNFARHGIKMPDETDEFGGRTAVASYVATLSADLAAMARRTGLDTLGYLLEMVRLEPESSSRHSRGPNGRRSSA